MKNANLSTFRHVVSFFLLCSCTEYKRLNVQLYKMVRIVLQNSLSSSVFSLNLWPGTDRFTDTVTSDSLISASPSCRVRQCCLMWPSDPPHHRCQAALHIQLRTGMCHVRLMSKVTQSIQVLSAMSDRLDKTGGDKDKRLWGSCRFYLGARQVELDCTAEASGFIGISQRLNGTPGLLSLFHREPTLPGGG